MPIADIPDFDQLSLDDRVDRVCDEFEREWKEGTDPEITAYVEQLPEAERPVFEQELRRVAFELNCTTIDSRISRDTQSVDLAQIDVFPARYAVRWLIASGGCGRVYLAHDTMLSRDVAIKLPHPDIIAQTGAANTLLAEGKMAALLEHPSIVPVYDCGLTTGGILFIVSKFIDGNDLSSLIRSESARTNAVPWMIELADAIAHAHSLGIIHRDIKPHNVIIDHSGKAYITDFGLAIPLRGLASLTTKGLTGTIPYMSPEQAEEAGNLDFRSDVFSLGVLLYELLTGERPFKGATPEEILENVKSCAFRPPSAVTPWLDKRLERICLKAMSPNPDARYANAAELRDALVRYQQRQQRGKVRLAAYTGLLAVALALPYWYFAAEVPSVAVPAIGTTEITDRDLAQWVLSQSGTVTTAAAPDVTLRRSEELPKYPFSLHSITLPHGPRRPDGDELFGMLTQAVDLSSLINLEVNAASAPTMQFTAAIRAPNLRQMWLNNSTVGDPELLLFSEAASLNHLNLNGTRVTDTSARLIAGFRRLEYLDVSNTPVTSSFVHPLMNHPRLEVVRLQNTLVDDSAIATLASIPKLRRLDLRGTRISGRAVHQLVSAKPACVVSFVQLASE